MNKKWLRLYTSNEPNERRANKIYDKLGFKPIKSKNINEIIAEANESAKIVLAGRKDGLFEYAKQATELQQWEQALKALGEVRAEFPEYKTLEVDGLYFTALRNRGVDLILNTGYHEMGLYYLGLAEQYAPLDNRAETYRTWAKIYRYADAEWGLDMNKAFEYYEVLVDICPYLTDTRGVTVLERYEILAKIYYATPTPTITLTETMTPAITITPTETLIPEETATPEIIETDTPEIIETPTPTEEE